MLLKFITDQYFWLLIALLLVNFLQKKYNPQSQKKRMAVIWIAFLTLIWYLCALIILKNQWPHWLAAIAFFFVAVVGIILRKATWPFRTTCSSCGKKLTFRQWLSQDENLCNTCQNNLSENLPFTVDWNTWTPQELCVICYLFDSETNRVLLIEKKRGLGDGLINAPGGHIETEETAEEAAIREFFEETGISVTNLTHMGILNFQFTDGLSMKGDVFFTNTWSGDMRETDEAKPFWCPISEIPYAQMWQDDELWLPQAIAGTRFEGRFIFDDRTMLSAEITPLSEHAHTT